MLRGSISRGVFDMAIGEFGDAPASPSGSGLVLSTPMYWFYEMSHAALNPVRALADATRLFDRATRRYHQPDWDIASAEIDGQDVPVQITCLWERPFCRLLHFERNFER